MRNGDPEIGEFSEATVICREGRIADAVLPLTVQEVVPWQQIRPSRHDLMALEGVVLENAADMARCFPNLWPSAQAARQDRQRSVTNCY